MRDTNGHSGNGTAPENGHSQQPPDSGGSGAGSQQLDPEIVENGGIRTTRMLKHAIEQRWPISPEHRKAIVNRLVVLAIHPDSSAREATSAAKAVISADKLNVEVTKGPESHQHLHVEGQVDWAALFDQTKPNSARDIIDPYNPRVEVNGNGQPPADT